ncbi:beta-ketoacyl synthase N-terminal-like domain-containing protein [Streptomyces sp. E11-3]|uniref:beta-ketoacyl synthase N-terminal-like domain-containing protein n=1 Tax=Streptomyces sp. E11-3 TaxID=3110112 RepID=UPI0039813DCF
MNGVSGMNGSLAVTGIGVVTPWGDSPQAGAAERGRPRSGAWFDHRERLGRRGYKYLPPAAQYALAAARTAAADGGGSAPGGVPDDRRGLVFATNGGLAGVLDTMDETVVEGPGAHGLSPALAPYFAVNVLGNRVAAELGLKGLALTVASPVTASLDAVTTGARALSADRAGSLLLTAAEEPLPSGAGEQGAVALALEPASAAHGRGAQVHGTLRSRSGFIPPKALTTGPGRERAAALLAGLVAELLPEPGTGPGAAPGPQPAPQVRFVTDGSAGARAAAAMVADVLGTGHQEPGAPHGGTLAAALEVAHAVTARRGRTLVVAAGAHGQVGLGLVSSPAPLVELV